MQNSHHAHTAANVVGIGGQCEDRIGGAFNEQVIDFLLMPAREGATHAAT